jgi:tetraacyldisaccharide 4'-kinase
MREPLSEIARADLIFVTKAIQADHMTMIDGWVRRYGPIPPKSPIQLVPVPFQPVGLRPMSDFKSLQSHNASFDGFVNRAVIAFSALAQSGQFEQDLKQLGLQVLQHFQYEDHHVYTEGDLAVILEAFAKVAGQNPVLVTTDKDLTKVRRLLPEAIQDKVYTLQMLPVLDGRWFYDEFLTQIPGHVRAKEGHVPSSSL